MKRLASFIVILAIALMGIQPISASARIDSGIDYLRYAVYVGGCCTDTDTEPDASNVEKVVHVTERFYYDDGGYTFYYELFHGGRENPSRGYGDFDWDASNAYIDSSKFAKLKKSEKDRFLAYILTILENEIAYSDERNALAGSNASASKAIPTVKNGQSVYDTFVKELGVGTSTVAAVMHNISPDFMTANRIASPFVQTLNVILGILGIVLMAVFFLTMLLDLTYLAIPMFREFLKGKKNDSKGLNIGQFVSDEAIKAVEEAEGGGQNGQGTGNAPWAYIKRKWLTLILFMILLVALISGRMMSIASSVINLVSGVFD